MNFADLQLSDTATMEVVDPRDGKTKLMLSDGTPASITFHGVDSKVYRRSMHSRRKVLVEASREKGADGFQASEDFSLGVLLDTIASWNIEIEGKIEPFAPELGFVLFDKYAWLREQAEMFVQDRRNFMRASSES